MININIRAFRKHGKVVCDDIDDWNKIVASSLVRIGMDRNLDSCFGPEWVHFDGAPSCLEKILDADFSFVAYSHGLFAGCVAMASYVPKIVREYAPDVEMFIHSLCVGQDFRGCGLGKKLMKRCLRQAGAKTVALNVVNVTRAVTRAEMVLAKRMLFLDSFYTRLGFQRVPYTDEFRLYVRRSLR